MTILTTQDLREAIAALRARTNLVKMKAWRTVLQRGELPLVEIAGKAIYIEDVLETIGDLNARLSRIESRPFIGGPGSCE